MAERIPVPAVTIPERVEETLRHKPASHGRMCGHEHRDRHGARDRRPSVDARAARRRHRAGRSDDCARPQSHECPEPLCPWRALPAHGATSRVASEDITPPSSLIRAHASDQVPPGASVVPRTPGPCRLSPVPAGGWPFPTLSLQSLRRRLDPYPAASLECTCPFLPREHRPHGHGRCVRHAKLSLQCNVNREPYFGAAVIRFYLQAPTLARLGPQIASTAASSCWAAGPFTPRIARVVTHSGMWHRYVSDLGN